MSLNSTAVAGNNCTDTVINAISVTFDRLIFNKSPFFVFTDVPANDYSQYRQILVKNALRKFPVRGDYGGGGLWEDQRIQYLREWSWKGFAILDSCSCSGNFKEFGLKAKALAWTWTHCTEDSESLISCTFHCCDRKNVKYWSSFQLYIPLCQQQSAIFRD